MARRTSQRFLAGLGLAGLIGLLLSLVLPTLAAPQVQFTPFPTPTPGLDGRIIYIVQPNDSWWLIAARFNLKPEQLYELNNATSETILAVGKEVLLGFGGPAEVTPTAGPTPTPAPLLPTPTPRPGSGTLCVLVYDDTNGDSLRQEEEVSIPEGAISVTDRARKVSLTQTTSSGLEPYCFEDLPEGEYNVSVAVPDGYNPTTVLNYALLVEPGSETYLDFGAQISSAALAEAPDTTGSSRSLLFGIFGALLLLAGIALGVYAGWMGRAKSRGAVE
ncbi:MAG TPA: SdrD B-like domain-containing protein [Anaerolineales bacterium]|nr:SdrD B-like domain-containing protein [Anaerolineales bacterium]